MKKRSFLSLPAICVLLALPLAVAAGGSPLAGMTATAVTQVTLQDMQKLHIADFNLGYGKDTDGDSISNDVQLALGVADAPAKTTVRSKKRRKPNLLLGVRPDNGKRFPYSRTFTNGKKGQLLIEKVGGRQFEWFVNPKDGKAYFLGDPNINAKYLAFLGLRTPMPDCGTIDSAASDATNAGPQACIEAKFASCSPATATVAVTFLAEYVEQVDIVGPQNGKCAVAITYHKDPAYPALVGKSMSCRVDRTAKVLDFLFENNYSDCAGPLKDESVKLGLIKNGVPFSTVTHGTYFGPKRGMIAIAHSTDELATLWSQLYPDTTTAAAAPAVDFTKSSLAVIFGERKVASLEVDQLYPDSFSVVDKSQPANCPVSMSQPFVAITYDKGAYDGSHSESSVGSGDGDCRPASPASDTNVYSNTDYGFTVTLPDATRFFTIASVPAASDLQGSYPSVSFSLHSALDGKDHRVFSIYVIPDAKWTDNMAISYKSPDGGVGGTSAQKIGSVGGNTLAQTGGDFEVPDDIGSYDFDTITMAQ